jgi:lysophospholipase L1-like esterase
MRRSARPVVSELEGRLLLAGAGVLAARSPFAVQPANRVEAAAIASRWVSTTPVPGDSPLPRGVPLAAWLKLHRKFTLQARRQANDVVFLGDSFMEGWGGAGKAVWKSQLAPLNAVSFGIHGDYTQNVLWRVLNGELSGRPRVAVVMVGFNNLADGQSPAETIAGITAVVKAVRSVSPGTRVLLLGILPCGPRPGTTARARIEQVNAAISRLADDSVTYLDIGRRFLQRDGTISTTVLADYVHPTPAGYQIFAAAIRGPLRGLLSR